MLASELVCEDKENMSSNIQKVQSEEPSQEATQNKKEAVLIDDAVQSFDAVNIHNNFNLKFKPMNRNNNNNLQILVQPSYEQQLTSFGSILQDTTNKTTSTQLCFTQSLITSPSFQSNQSTNKHSHLQIRDA